MMRTMGNACTLTDMTGHPVSSLGRTIWSAAGWNMLYFLWIRFCRRRSSGIRLANTVSGAVSGSFQDPTGPCTVPPVPARLKKNSNGLLPENEEKGCHRRNEPQVANVVTCGFLHFHTFSSYLAWFSSSVHFEHLRYFSS